MQVTDILRLKLVEDLIASLDYSIVRLEGKGVVVGLDSSVCLIAGEFLFGFCYNNNKSGSEFEIN